MFLDGTSRTFPDNQGFELHSSTGDIREIGYHSHIHEVQGTP